MNEKITICTPSRPTIGPARRPSPGSDGPIMRCPECHRVYWPGSHVRRMLAKLTRAQAERPGR